MVTCPFGSMMGSMPAVAGVGLALSGLLVAALIGLAISATVRLLRTPQGSPGGDARSAALAALDLRYARGEVAREQYLRQRLDLGERR